MSASLFPSATGPATVADAGQLIYNDVEWSALYHSSIRASNVYDDAGRTVKYVEYTLEVDGFVTCEPDEDSIDLTMDELRWRLEQPGGSLVYADKGFGRFSINVPGGTQQYDVNWGPKPKLLEFTPYGDKAANVRWTVVVCIPELKPGTTRAPAPIIQFTQEISISYDEEGYTHLSIRGNIEMPMTRIAVDRRDVHSTIDGYRKRFLDISVDLTRFRVTKRDFNISRDRRTCDWEYLAEELAPMAPPPGATVARGTFSVRPVKHGYALMPWVCSLCCTYTIRKDKPARFAYAAFAMLLKFRMECSRFGVIPNIADISGKKFSELFPGIPNVKLDPALGGGRLLTPRDLKDAFKKVQKLIKEKVPRALLIHFGYDEGLYLDSKTVTFEASWRLITTIHSVLNASGIWRNTGYEKLWKASVEDIMGWRSWQVNALDPKADVIVDLGGGTPGKGI